MRKKIVLAAFAAFALLGQSVTAQGTKQKKINLSAIAETRWRGLFLYSSGLEIPFNFLIKKNAAGVNKIYLLNAEEKFEGGTVKEVGDSVFAALDQFDNEFAFKYENEKLKGSLRRQDGKGTPTPVVAELSKDVRFISNNVKPDGDISGTYDIVFAQAGGKEEKAVGLFTQSGNKLKATFLKVTGDSRFLEGIVEGSTLR